jgi:hypothetical protein
VYGDAGQAGFGINWRHTLFQQAGHPPGRCTRRPP